MSYIHATTELKKLIAATNKNVVENRLISYAQPNHLFLKSKLTNNHITMDAFNDAFIKEQLRSASACNSLVFTNLATMKVKDKELTYILYKGYHGAMEHGLVYFQTVNKETLEPIGELQFSNQEDNIFFDVAIPETEESSCNAMETKASTTQHKQIVFLLGNFNEDRLLFDMERLIITTINNCEKHPTLNFKFIINMDKFGGKFSETFQERLNPVKSATKKYLQDYQSIQVSFEYAK